MVFSHCGFAYQERWSAENLLNTDPYMLEAAKLSADVLKETLAKLTAHKNAQLLGGSGGGSGSGSASPSPQASPYNSDVKDKEKSGDSGGDSPAAAAAAPDTPGKGRDAKRDKRQSEFMITAPKFVGHAADPAGLDGIKQTILDLRNDLNKERAKSKTLEDENVRLVVFLVLFSLVADFAFTKRLRCVRRTRSCARS